MLGSDIIRVKIKGFLRNITEEENIFFDEKGIKNKNKISFISDDVRYSIKYFDSEVILSREGKDFINIFVFHKEKGTSTYTLKENNYTIQMSIIVNDMVIEDNLIDIKYMIVETGCEYEYKIEMSECL